MTFQLAATKDWRFLTVGAAPWTSYKMFSDELFGNLTNENQKIHQPLFEQAQAHLDKQYEKIHTHNNTEVKAFISGLKSTGIFQKFLDKMTLCAANRSIVEGLQFSIDYWEMYGNGDVYQKNMDSAKKDKISLTQDLKRINFDFEEDKLFVKMYRKHLSKGYSPSGAYGVGSMLLEMAEIHDNNSLAIGFLERYSIKDDEVKDILETQDLFSKRYQEFVQLGKKQDWVLIDLRPFNKKFYYGPYDLSLAVFKMMTRYDILIIPKADTRATPNY